MKKIRIKISLIMIVFFLYLSIGFAETVRVVQRIDGSVAIIHPAPNSRQANEIEQEWLDRVFNETMEEELSGLVYEDIPKSELPQSREYRNAWEWDSVNKKVKVNSIKADEIKNDKLIRERMEKIRVDKDKKQAIAELRVEGLLPRDLEIQ